MMIASGESDNIRGRYYFRVGSVVLEFVFSLSKTLIYVIDIEKICL